MKYSCKKMWFKLIIQYLKMNFYLLPLNSCCFTWVFCWVTSGHWDWDSLGGAEVTLAVRVLPAWPRPGEEITIMTVRPTLSLLCLPAGVVLTLLRGQSLARWYIRQNLHRMFWLSSGNKYHATLIILNNILHLYISNIIFSQYSTK